MYGSHSISLSYHALYYIIESAELRGSRAISQSYVCWCKFVKSFNESFYKVYVDVLPEAYIQIPWTCWSIFCLCEIRHFANTTYPCIYASQKNISGHSSSVVRLKWMFCNVGLVIDMGTGRPSWLYELCCKQEIKN